MRKYSGPSARAGLVFRLALLLLRESHYQMGKYKYEERGRRPRRRELVLSSLGGSLLINLFGAAVVIMLMMGPGPFSSRLLAVEAITVILSFIAAFENSWMLETYGHASPLRLLPLSDVEIGAAYLTASSLALLWGIAALPLSALLAGSGPVAAATAAISVAASLAIGVSVGLGLSVLVGGHRYSGPSRKATMMQAANVAVYSIVFILVYQVYALSHTIAGMADALASTAATAGWPLLLVFPFHVLLMSRPYSLLLSLLWLAAGAYALRKSSSAFVSSSTSPIYVVIRAASRPLSLSYSHFLSLQLAAKDFKLIFRDVRRAPLLVVPPIVIVSMLSGVSAAEAPIGIIPVIVMASSVAFVSNTFSAVLGLQSFRIDGKFGWLLFASGLRRSEYAKSKLVFSLLSSAFYYAVGTAAFAVLGSANGSAALILALASSLAGFALSIYYPISSMALRVGPEGYGTEPRLKLELVAILLAAMSAVASIPAVYVAEASVSALLVLSALLMALGLTGFLGRRRLQMEGKGYS